MELKRKYEFLDSESSIECPICCELLSPPVYQCENGHLACTACQEYLKTKKCPYCRSKKVTYSRNLAVEKILESLVTSCRYSPRGCKEMVKVANRKEHENDLCDYRPAVRRSAITSQSNIEAPRPPAQNIMEASRPPVQNTEAPRPYAPNNFINRTILCAENRTILLSGNRSLSEILSPSLQSLLSPVEVQVLDSLHQQYKQNEITEEYYMDMLATMMSFALKANNVGVIKEMKLQKASERRLLRDTQYYARRNTLRLGGYLRGE